MDNEYEQFYNCEVCQAEMVLGQLVCPECHAVNPLAGYPTKEEKGFAFYLKHQELKAELEKEAKEVKRVTLYNIPQIEGKLVRRIYLGDGREVISVIPEPKKANKKQNKKQAIS